MSLVIFGLTNLGALQSSHEDPAHEKHCNVKVV
jgi:hypothetical protein